MMMVAKTMEEPGEVTRGPDRGQQIASADDHHARRAGPAQRIAGIVIEETESRREERIGRNGHGHLCDLGHCSRRRSLAERDTGHPGPDRG